MLYSRDQDLLNRVTQYIGSALDAGYAAIVIATESHRNSLLKSLNDYGLNIEAAVEQGTYLALDAVGMLSTSIVDGALDCVGCFRSLHSLTVAAAEAAKTGRSRVVIFRECVQVLGHKEMLRPRSNWRGLATNLQDSAMQMFYVANLRPAFKGKLGATFAKKSVQNMQLSAFCDKHLRASSLGSEVQTMDVTCIMLLEIGAMDISRA